MQSCSNLFQRMRLIVLLSLGLCHSFRLKSSSRLSSRLSLSTPFSLDSAEVQKIPGGDIISRYCEEDPASTPRLADSLMEYGNSSDDESNGREHLLYGRCEEDEDCAKAGSGRPFCVDSICRECREGSEFEDCGPIGAFCNAETGYTCSTCQSDNDCTSMSFCRSVFSAQSMFGTGKMPKKSCIKCEHVPEVGEVVDSNTCEWRCPIETYYMAGSSAGEPPSCLDCPRCSTGQYYAPRATLKTEFVPVCTNATDVVCAECAAIGIDDSKPEMCARILTPSVRHSDDETAGDLGAHMPCRFFKCKDGWFLSGSRTKCKRCHLTMCPVGQYLKGCGEAEPGACADCKGRLPKGAHFIDPTDPRYKVVKPDDACQFKCPKETVFSASSNECVACGPEADELCDNDKLYTLSLVEQ